VTQGVARGLLRFSPSGWTKDGLTLIVAGKILTPLPLYATLPSCAARHGKIIRTGTDLEAGKPGERPPWFHERPLAWIRLQCS
jgi:hypothetical protein